MGRIDAILTAFGDVDRVLGVSEISRRVGLPKSTVHRLTDQLCSTGWLERNSGGYRVGLKLLEHGGIPLRRSGLREAAFRHMYPLAQKTGLGVQLGILDHGQVVYIERLALTTFRLPTRVGGRQPAYCTALGKAMLAFEDKQTQESAMSEMPRRTDATIVDPRELGAELETVSRTGVAYDRQESYAGLVCVAAPIRGTGRALGAISITGPLGRMRLDALTVEVRNAARAVWGGGRAAVA